MNVPSKSLQAVSKVKAVTKFIPAGDLISVFSTLTEAYKENKKIKNELKEISAKKELLIKDMEMRYDLYYKVFGQIFQERSLAINQSFEIIKKGLDENDKELISMGLGSLSQIVSSSPFSNLSELSKLLESNKIIEI